MCLILELHLCCSSFNWFDIGVASLFTNLLYGEHFCVEVFVVIVKIPVVAFDSVAQLRDG